jgi:hypothetical protein
MKKKINNFLDTANLFKIFVFGYFVSSIVTIVTYYLLSHLVGPKMTLQLCGKIGAIFGILLGLIFALGIGAMRKSDKFWSYAKIVDRLIDNAESKSKLDSIHKWEFETLRKMAQGGPHVQELKRLRTIMETKYRYVK